MGFYKSAFENKIIQSRIDKEQQKIKQHNNTQMVLLKYKNEKAIKEKEHQEKINRKLLQANEMITKQKNYIHKKNIEILVKKGFINETQKHTISKFYDDFNQFFVKIQNFPNFFINDIYLASCIIWYMPIGFMYTK